MNAIDTNLLVRYLTNDHPEQAEAARRLIDAGDIWIADTVVLETEWVLRAVYGFEATEVSRAIRAVGGLPVITLETPALVAFALDRMDEGLDFADALHLGASLHCDAFFTFDRSLLKAAKSIDHPPVRRPA